MENITQHEHFVKVGDKLICNDAFSDSGYIEGEIIEINTIDQPNYGIDFTVTILAKFRLYRNFKAYIREIKINTCSIKINPFDININMDWTSYGSFCKGIFFTSEEEKKKFVDKFNKCEMNYHLNMARKYGYDK